jgi:DGQHR domain-containing protein
MTDFIEARAWKNNHSGVDFFAFFLESKTLLKIAYVSEDERDKGVQRPLSERRCKDVAKFIDSHEGIFANNLILNFPKEAEFISSENNASEGVIRIPDVSKSVWVIDGQHRLFGFQHSNKQLKLLCSGFINLNIERQAQIFITINQEQKGINPSVLYDLLPIIKDADFKKMRSQSLVKQLNEDSESPWFNEVKMLGVGKGLVSQAAFARNLETLIDPNGGILSQYPENLQYSILVNYFNAFKSLFFKEWGSSKHVLTKAIGLTAMCGIFPKIHSLCEKDFTVENILSQLSSLRGFDFTSSTRGKSTNKVAIQQFILEILGELPEAPQSTDIRV